MRERSSNSESNESSIVLCGSASPLSPVTPLQDMTIDDIDEMISNQRTHLSQSNIEGNARENLFLTSNTNKMKAQTLTNIAVDCYKEDDFETALSCLDESLDLYPDNTITLTNKGIVLNAIDRDQEARIWFEKSLEQAIAENDYNELSNRGITLHHLSRFDEAIVFYQKALKIHPEDADTLNWYGDALTEIGQYHEALKCFDTALIYAPNDTYVLMNRCELLEKIKNQLSIQNLAVCSMFQTLVSVEKTIRNNRSALDSCSERLSELSRNHF